MRKLLLVLAAVSLCALACPNGVWSKEAKAKEAAAPKKKKADDPGTPIQITGVVKLAKSQDGAVATISVVSSNATYRIVMNDYSKTQLKTKDGKTVNLDGTMKKSGGYMWVTITPPGGAK